MKAKTDCQNVLSSYFTKGYSLNLNLKVPFIQLTTSVCFDVSLIASSYKILCHSLAELFLLVCVAKFSMDKLIRYLEINSFS